MSALAVTAFAIGVLGGVHCIAMCGGIVGVLTLRRPGEKPLATAQLGFNAGRIASYALAGALAGSAAGAGLAVTTLLPAQLMLFVLANGLVILLGLYLAGMGTGVLLLERAGGRIGPVLRSFAHYLPDRGSLHGQLAAGALWGWTPCGLVYSALALALVSGSAANGAAVMLSFGLGTLPNLLGAGWLSARFGARLRRPGLRVAAGLAVALFGIVSLARVPGLAEHVKQGLLCLGG